MTMRPALALALGAITACHSAFAALGPNLLDDSDMEATHARAWPAAGTVNRIVKSSAHARSGNQSLHVITDASKWGGVRRVVTGLRPGATYRLSYWARRVRGDARLDVAVGDGKRWVGLFGGHSLAGPLIWWPKVAYIPLRDPSRTVDKPAGTLASVCQVRIQWRKAGGGPVEFYLDDVDLRESPDPLSSSQLQNGSFEQGAGAPESWSVKGDVTRFPSLASTGAACARLEPAARIEQSVRLAAATWYTVRYEWTTQGRGHVRVGLRYDSPQGTRYVDPRADAPVDKPCLLSPYYHRGFAKGFARVGVTFRTADHAGPYVVTFVNTGPDDAYLDGVVLAPDEPASSRWPTFDIPYDGDGSITGKPLRDMAGFLPEGPHSIEDVRARRTVIDRCGHIRVGSNGHFVDGRGKRVRFYAVNMPGLFAMPKTMEDAARIANRLAKLGVNLVRIHGADFKQKSWAPELHGLFGPASWRPGTTDLYPESVRRLDSFLAQCKAHGIYVQLDLMTGRTFTKADGVAELDALRRATSWHKTRLFVTSYAPRLIALQKRYQTQLLTHVNEYTGLEYAADPVIASVELKNEEGLLYSGFTRPIHAGYPPRYQRLLVDRWNEWLRARYADGAALREAWAEQGSVGLGNGEGVGQAAFAPDLRDPGEYSRARYADMVRFTAHLVERYQRDMVAHLRGLGLKCPIRDTQAQSRPGQVRAQSSLDYVDAHSYWGAAFDQAMVRSAGGNLIVPSFIAVAGKPMTVSEYNAPSGQKYRAEMPILFAAYAAFQDWDCITLHSYGGAAGQLDARALQFHYIASYGDAAVVSQFPVAAKIFREGLVRPGRRTVELRYTRQQCDSGESVVPAVPPETALVHRVRTIGFTAAQRMEADGSRGLRSPYVSDTDELRWDTQAGVATVQAPQVEAAIGFLGGRSVRLGHLRLTCDTAFGAVSLVALDGRPLRESAAVLLTAAAQAENTAMAWANGRTRVLNYGYEPVRAEPVAAAVEVLGTKAARVFALGPDGARSREVTVTAEAGGIRFRLEPEYATLWYEISP